MTTDLYQNDQSPQKLEHTAGNELSFTAEQAMIPKEAAGDPSLQSKGMLPIIMNNAQFLEFQEKVFSIITENSGKLIFADLLKIVGGEPYKPTLYKVLMNLAKQQRIVRIRGIGKKRIEFYYHDTKKLKKLPASAAVSYVQI